MEGESLTFVRGKEFTTSYIDPCTSGKGRKMAKIRLNNPPANIIERMARAKGFERPLK